MKKLIALMLCLAMLTGLIGCANIEEIITGDDGGLAKISLYPADAKLLSGIVDGYRGEFFAEHGIELNVWAYSAERTNAIFSSGSLPDIMYIADDDLATAIEGGMVLCLEDYLDQIPNLAKYEKLQEVFDYMREYKSANTDKVWGLPLNVGDTLPGAVPATDRYAVKILWDVYAEIGYPEINSLDDLIDVMEQMKAAHPTNKDGNKIFGTVLNGGGDTTYFSMMFLWYVWQGYMVTDLPYFLERNMVAGEATSIFENDSVYREGLKWLNEVYRRGLLDEDSINIDRATQAPKIDNGLAFVPAGSLPGYAPKYHQVYIPGTTIYYRNSNPFGSNYTLCVNAKTNNLDACLELLNMWVDPYTYFVLNYGPEGDAWRIDGENMYLTDRFVEYLDANGWSQNGYKYENGEQMTVFNTSFVLNHGEGMLDYKDGNGNYRGRLITSWAEFGKSTREEESFKDWQAHYGADNWVELLESKDALVTESKLFAIDPFLSIASDATQLTLDAIKDVVVSASWNMVYAESEADFDKIWDNMVDDAMALGAQKIIDNRLAEYKTAIDIAETLLADN